MENENKPLPKTLEEWAIRELESCRENMQDLLDQRNELSEKNMRLESIVDTIKEYAKFDGEYISILIGGYDGIKDRNYLVKEFGLEKEDNE
jgi:hypothetical protein